ncbi:MAG: hypothetical protein KDD37_07415, partial [Bdellovibrionales bacterium]|nr:hypothetical protein [Bdellovibrionales bacterium]
FDLKTDLKFTSDYAYDAKGPLEQYLLYKDERFLLSLIGQRGFDNTLLALYCLNILNIQIDFNKLKAISKVKWPHRFSQLKNSIAPCPVFLSGDHNPEGIKSFTSIVRYLKYHKIWIIAGITEGRDPNLLFDPLLDIPLSQLILTTSPFKGQTLEDYERLWKHFSTSNCVAIADPKEAFQYAVSQAKTTDLIVVTGSLYLTGKIEEDFGAGLLS